MNRAHPFIERFGFFAYQKRWLADAARFKIGLWARQTGKDFCAAAEAVFDALTHPGTTWLVLAAGKRQALESLAKAKDWARACDLLLGASAGAAVATASEIRWPNGSRFIALPAKPETIRGYSANLILTEFAFFEDAEAVWRAIYPSISNPLRGGVKRLRIISTPNGPRNKFAELWREGAGYSKHFTDIYQAVNDGLALDLEQLRRGLRDAEAWTQEYECQFIDQSSVLLPSALIQSRESPDAFECASIELLSAAPGELFMGIDFGRSRDLTVCWTLERPRARLDASPPAETAPDLITREVLVLEKMSTPEQMRVLQPRVELARRTCLDYTGAGIGLGDLLAQRFGLAAGANFSHGLAGSASRLELCPFTPAFKAELFAHLRAAFERGIVAIPSSPAIREDLHGVHRVVSNSGQIRYQATHSADGHSDRCIALALALRAAGPPAALARPEPARRADRKPRHPAASMRHRRLG